VEGDKSREMVMPPLPQPERVAEGTPDETLALGEKYASHGYFVQAVCCFQSVIEELARACPAANPRLRVTALLGLAGAEFQLGRDANAERSCRQALQAAEAELESNSPERARCRLELARVLSASGCLDEGKAILTALLDEARGQFGPASLEVAEVLVELGSLHHGCGLPQEAERLYMQALCLQQAAPDSGRVPAAESLTGLGNLYAEQGENQQARSAYVTALRILTEALGEADARVGGVLYNLSLLDLGDEEYSSALLGFQKALAVEERMLGPEHPATADTVDCLGRVYHGLNRPTDALKCYERSLRTWRRTLGEAHPRCAVGLFNLARWHAEFGERQQAIELYETVASAATEGDIRHLRIDALLNVAELYSDLALFERARSSLERALLLDEQEPNPDGGSKPDILYRLGLLRCHEGEFQEAHELLTDALRLARESGDYDPADLDRIEQQLENIRHELDLA
jgi:tetratricopeptide (TPR) repeat protein